MKSALLVLALIAFGCVCAQNPSKPVWPKQFAATVRIDRSDAEGYHRTDVVRWFYDYTKSKERLDGMSEWHREYYFTTYIADYTAKTQYSVYYRENEVSCITSPTNGSMVLPDFSAFRFAGGSLVDYQTAYHWILDSTSNHHFYQYWDRQDNREPLRIDLVNEETGRDETWTFHEFDAGAQDNALFEVPDTIAPLCFSPSKVTLN